MPTQNMATAKEIEEKNYLLIVDVFNYTNFLYSCSRLMIELINKLNTITNHLLDSGCKYTDFATIGCLHCYYQQHYEISKTAYLVNTFW
jgi:hypothetical protein